MPVIVYDSVGDRLQALQTLVFGKVSQIESVLGSDSVSIPEKTVTELVEKILVLGHPRMGRTVVGQNGRCDYNNDFSFLPLLVLGPEKRSQQRKVTEQGNFF